MNTHQHDGSAPNRHNPFCVSLRPLRLRAERAGLWLAALLFAGAACGGGAGPWERETLDQTPQVF
jgi:hypothetical protein